MSSANIENYQEGSSSESNDRAADVCELKNLEKISDGYLKDLQLKKSDLEQRLNEQTSLSGELQEFMYEIQGKAQVHQQRSEDLGLENFKAMMVQAKNELESAKRESQELSRLLYSSCKKMLDDIDKGADTLENIRNEYKNMPRLNQSSDLNTGRPEELVGHLNEMEKKIKELESSKQNMSSVLLNLHNVDVLKDYFEEEMNSTDEELSKLHNMKLHAI